jgi:hypothetical protein
MDSNDALLKSLESIKSLLAQSETKLSAARESLTQANQGTTMKRKDPEFNIPTLDEVVEPGEQIEFGLPDEADIPTLESVEEESPIFNFEDAQETGEATMAIDTSNLPFDLEDESEEEPIPVLEITSPSVSEPINDTADEDSVEVISSSPEPALPDLTPLLSAIDDIEGSMRSQISEAAIAFEERLNNHLEAQLRKVREQVHALSEQFKEK